MNYVEVVFNENGSWIMIIAGLPLTQHISLNKFCSTMVPINYPVKVFPMRRNWLDGHGLFSKNPNGCVRTAYAKSHAEFLKYNFLSRAVWYTYSKLGQFTPFPLSLKQFFLIVLKSHSYNES